MIHKPVNNLQYVLHQQPEKGKKKGKKGWKIKKIRRCEENTHAHLLFKLHSSFISPGREEGGKKVKEVGTEKN